MGRGDGDLWQSALDLERDGSLSREAVVRITLPASPRSRKEVKAPFGDENRFGPLSIKWFDMAYIQNPLWPDYEATKDARSSGRLVPMECVPGQRQPSGSSSIPGTIATPWSIGYSVGSPTA